MKPPSRLLDDPELPAELRADLETVVRHPHEVDLPRVAAALAVSLGATAISSAAHASLSATPATGSGGALSALPVALKAALAAIGGGAVMALAATQLQPSAREIKAAPPPSASAPAREPASRPLAPAAPAPATVVPQPPAAPPTAPAGPSASRREIAQLRRIRHLLAKDPAAAQRLAEASQREFPHGALREEREGLRVLALFKLDDRARALQQARTFLEQRPQSPLAERIRELVADEPSP